MAASDASKSPEAKRRHSMHVKGENDEVSLEQAMEALKQAQALLDAYYDADTPWQDPVVLLNKTASALDEVALATRHDDHDDNSKTSPTALAIRQLSEEVISGRQKILNATHKVVSGNRPAELWNPYTLIIYATHTGTSRDYALELQRNLSDGPNKADVMNIKDVSLLDLQERKRVFFICSTFGLGRPPRDAEVVYSTLQILETATPEESGEMLVAEPEKEALAGLEFAVAALGNSKFEIFCNFGRELNGRLTALGGEELLPVALLDSANGRASQESQFRDWQQKVLRIEGVSPKPHASNAPKEGATDSDDIVTAKKSAVLESTCCTIQ